MRGGCLLEGCEFVAKTVTDVAAAEVVTEDTGKKGWEEVLKGKKGF